MPMKLKVLVGLFSLSFLGNVLTQQWILAVLTAGLLFGVIRGNEVVRRLLVVLAVIQIISAAAMALVVPAAILNGGSGSVALAIVTAMMAVFQILQGGFFLWCLRQEDVRQWMFRRSLGPLADEIG